MDYVSMLTLAVLTVVVMILLIYLVKFFFGQMMGWTGVSSGLKWTNASTWAIAAAIAFIAQEPLTKAVGGLPLVGDFVKPSTGMDL